MIYHETEHGILYCGDCLDIMKTLPDNSVDAVVTDPPYGLEFMGKEWDAPWKYNKMTSLSFANGGGRLPSFVSARNPICKACHKRQRGKNKCTCERPQYDTTERKLEDMRKFQDFVFAWASECLRVLKPGGYLLSFAGTRTQHRIACGIEDAGFEIRDMIAWVYGSGFPKSLDIGKSVDKMQGNEREIIGKIKNPGSTNKRLAMGNGWQENPDLTIGKSKYEGYGTALKPALEPITVARKPIEGTVAANVLKWGTGAIDIDGCRVGSETTTTTIKDLSQAHGNQFGKAGITYPKMGEKINPPGRFPANLIHDGSDEVLELFPETKSGKMKQDIDGGLFNVYGKQYPRTVETIGDSGSAARFFYCAKASKAERNAGLEDMQPVRESDRVRDDGVGGDNPRNRSNTAKQNHHPTVKPIALMEYLIKLVAREGYTVLDPFLGSGTTAIACVKQGRRYIGCEMDKDYCEIAAKRIESELDQTTIDLS